LLSHAFTRNDEDGHRLKSLSGFQARAWRRGIDPNGHFYIDKLPLGMIEDRRGSLPPAEVIQMNQGIMNYG